MRFHAEEIEEQLIDIREHWSSNQDLNNNNDKNNNRTLVNYEKRAYFQLKSRNIIRKYYRQLRMAFSIKLINHRNRGM